MSSDRPSSSTCPRAAGDGLRAASPRAAASPAELPPPSWGPAVKITAAVSDHLHFGGCFLGFLLNKGSSCQACLLPAAHVTEDAAPAGAHGHGAIFPH